MGTEQYDDSARGGYSYAEKLAMVAGNLMDPKEIGMVSSEDALKLLPEKKKLPKLGTTVMFRAGCVPMEIRLEWAKQDHIRNRKIVSPHDDFDQEAWLEANKDEYPIQGDLICGQAVARFSQTFKDPILGLCQMMRKAASMLEQKYRELDAEDKAATQQNESNQTTEATDAAPEAPQS